MNEAILRRFAALSQKGRLAHAYLFVGPSGVGKTQTALAVAKLLICEASGKGWFCDQCASCHKINRGNHPDCHLVGCPPGETIKIEQIREMIAQLQLKPFEAPQKISIVQDAENLTPDAANSLLKTLEEPTKQSLLILTTGCPEKILETIRSRCHRVYFGGLTPGRLADQLTKDYAIEATQAHVLAFFAEGYDGLAKRLAEDQFLVFKNEVIDQIIFGRNKDQYLKGILSDQQKTKEALRVLFTWFRDLLLLKTGVDSSGLVHADRLSSLQKQEARYSFQTIDDILEEIVKTRRLLEENLNIKISFGLLKEKLWRG